MTTLSSGKARLVVSDGPDDRLTRRLLVAGLVAGPLWVASVLIQGLTRDGFDLKTMAPSLLSRGGLGWIQVTTFVVSGGLVIAFAVGLRRAMRGGRFSLLAPCLAALNGLGLAIAGVFRIDPAMGYPPGAPEGIPDTVSTEGTLHGVGFMVAFSATLLLALVFAWRFWRDGAKSWAAGVVAVMVVAVFLAAQPVDDWTGVRLICASSLSFGWLAALAARTLFEAGREAPPS